MCRGGVTNEGHECKSILRRSVRLPGAGLFRRTRAARSSQMRLVRVVGDSLPIATESRVEIWNARRRDTRFSSGIYSCVYVPRDALILSLSLSPLYMRARARAYVFVSSPFLSLSVSLPFSQAARRLLFLPLFAPLLAPSGIRMYECTLARLLPCLSFSRCVRVSRTLFLCPCSSLRSLACAWKRCHPSVERCCHRFVPLLLGEYLRSSS